MSIYCRVHKNKPVTAWRCDCNAESKLQTAKEALREARETLNMISQDYYNEISPAEIFEIHGSMANEALSRISAILGDEGKA